MTRAPTGNETKRQSNGAMPSSSNQRLVAASKRALEAHARVQRFATHLSEELARSEELEYDPAQGIPLELDREDSMVIAVEKVIATAKSTTPPPIAEMTSSSREEVALPRASTRRGIVSLRKPTGG